MRDPKRIPEIMAHLTRIWQANPDFRLAQLITVAARPSEPCPGVFYKEDDALLKGLLEFEEAYRNRG